MFHYHPKGIKLTDHDLFLDAHYVVSFSFISHGHGDHLRNHKRILATPPTIDFFNLRFEHRVRKPEFLTLNFFQPLELEKMTITLYPAGHILGSAMILLEEGGRRLLYTGDFKLQPGFTTETIQIPEADILIMESTYGSPKYQFARERVRIPRELDAIVSEILRKGYLPVILAYSLGKAQEAMAMLGKLGYHVRVHPAAWRIAEIYMKYGLPFPHCSELDETLDPREEVLIIPPHLERKLGDYIHYPAIQTIFLSGWAMTGRGSPSPANWDYALPLSDHADFNELVEFVRRVNPEKVYTLHGFPEFPGHLQEAGFSAEFLQKPGN